MFNFRLLIKRVDGGRVPEWRGGENAGLDLHSNVDCVIEVGTIKLVNLGIATAFPEQYVGLLRDRSGLGSRGLHVLAGVIDSSYRGEWVAALMNLGMEDVKINRFDRVCQCIFTPRFQLQITPTDILPDSIRGSSGFGSTGV